MFPVMLVVGAAIWLMAMKGVANYAESACLADVEAQPLDRGYTMSREFWPPSFECRLRGGGAPDVTINHPVAGVAAAATVVVVPTILLFCISGSLWWMLRRSPGDVRTSHTAA
jgi:hypothetical protein